MTTGTRTTTERTITAATVTTTADRSTAAAPAAEPHAHDPAALLQLLWLASPALPVGGFSYSDGLGAAIDAGFVHDETTAGAWLGDQLRLTLGRSELPLVAAAIAAWRADDLHRVRALNDWCGITRESAEFRQQTSQMGRSLAVWLANRSHDVRGTAQLAFLTALDPAPCWPVAFALAAARTGAAAGDALLAFAFGWAENVVQAAVKAVPLGQSAGQRILGRLTVDIPSVVDQAALRLADDQRQAHSPMLAILSARHEVQYSRLFRS